MPIYEYECRDCGRRFSFLYGVTADSRDPACPRCQSRSLTRLMSRFTAVKSEESRLEDMADPSKVGNLEDPKAVAKWAKKMGGALGEDAGEDFDQMIDEMMEAEGKKEKGEEAGGGDFD